MPKRADRTLASKQAPTTSSPPPGADTCEPIRIGPSTIAGRGVFATRDLAEGEYVHLAPVLLLPDEDHELLADTAIDGYVYEWFEGGVAFALGLGSFFNHADDPNCSYELADEEHPAWPAMAYLTRRAVAAGEELTVSYTDGTIELWFDPV